MIVANAPRAMASNMATIRSVASKHLDLTGYIPGWVRAYLAGSASSRDAAWLQEREAAALLLDIAGFTELTDRLFQSGERGAEELSNILNSCFGLLTDIVAAHGGDIGNFIGDGFIALWPKDQFEHATHLAAQCALALREGMNDWSKNASVPLKQRTVVESGAFCFCKLGGRGDRWQFCVVGAPFLNMGALYKTVSVGEVWLCERACAEIAERCVGEHGPGGLRLDRLKFGIEVEPVAAPPSGVELDLKCCVAPIVLERLAQGAVTWLAELRNVSMLSINLPAASFDADLFKILQPSVLTIQAVAADLEGVVFGAWMDDKGICVALGFGAPPLAHEEDPSRAVEAALRIRDELAALSVGASIGVASGKLFCGDYGGRSRRDYGVLGPAINVATRLMEIANGSVLCDEATAQAAKGRVGFSVLPPQLVKGRASWLSLYSPMRMRSQPQLSYPGDIVGREAERRELDARLEAARRGVGGVVVVEGEPGIGKSRLLGYFVRRAVDAGFSVLRGHASAIDRSTPYFAWRQLLAAMIEDEAGAGGPAPHVVLANRLGRDPDLISWLPVIGDILPIGLGESPLTRQIAGSARATSIEEVIVGLLCKPSVVPPILVFEDVHWFDEASWALLQGVVRRVPQLLVVVSRRAVNAAESAEVRGFGALVHQIHLADLAGDAVAEILKRRLRAVRLPPEFVPFVQKRAGGNPFYCEELASALRDAGVLSVQRGECVINVERLDDAAPAIPATLEGAIVTRLDALPTRVQLLAKVASALGGPFTSKDVGRIFPGPASGLEREAMLACLVERDLLRRVGEGAAPRYEFRHAIIEEVTYRLLSFAQRRLLHAEIAAMVESRHSNELAPYYGLLARHWERAEEWRRAIECLERAAEHALRGFANSDALRHIRKAFELSREKNIAPADPERLSRWETILGDAYNELADYQRSVTHYERALTLLAQTVAKSGSALGAQLIGSFALQAWLRLVPLRFAAKRTEDAARIVRIAHIRERLAERHFFRSESLAVLNETLTAVNLAERSGAVAEMISGYSALAVGLGMSGLRRTARYYRDKALGLAERRDVSPEAARAYLLAGVLGFGLGEWEATQRFTERSVGLYRQLGDRARALTPLTVLASVFVMRGDLARAESVVVESADTRYFELTGQGRAWRLAAQVMIAAIRGEVDPGAVAQLNQAIDASLTRADQLLCLGTVASGYLRLGELEKALAAAERGLPLIYETGAVWGNYIYGVSGVIEAYLSHWAAETQPATLRAECRNKALLACKHAQRATRASPVCQPQTLLLRGRAALLSGRRASARRMWTRAAAAAEALQMQRELGLALHEIGRLSAASDPGRRKQLSRAAKIFDAMGAKADLAAVGRTLSS